MTPKTTLPLLGLLLTAGLCSIQSVRGCAILARQPEVKISGEEVLIVWDSRRKVEHLIRHLSFKDAKSDFAFLVPTPGRPELSEVDDAIFLELYLNVYNRITPKGPTGGTGRTGGTGSHSVKVIEQKRVAGMDATVLAANDPGALNAWLARHRYPQAPATYLEPYLKKGWFITAFRYVPEEGKASTRALRMSFATNAPYFPYAEPQNAIQHPNRNFRVTIVAEDRKRGHLGKEKWKARPIYAAQDRNIKQVLDRAGLSASMSDDLWVTTIDDPDSTRGKHDLYFVTDEDQTPVATVGVRRVE